MRIFTLAAVLAFVSVAPTVAQPATSIEHLRGFAAAGMAPMNADIDELTDRCPGLSMPMDMTPAEFAEARALHIDAGALWLRKHDAEIAKCLAGHR